MAPTAGTATFESCQGRPASEPALRKAASSPGLSVSAPRATFAALPWVSCRTSLRTGLRGPALA